MRVLYKRPADAGFRQLNIDNDLNTLQDLVGGYIETVTVRAEPKVVLICNDEGVIRMDMKYNCAIRCNDASGGFDYPFYGPILLVGEDDEEFTDCPISLMVANGMIR